ncbi:MAG: hypothetical protein EOP41_10705, partial [Sphingobacteriaceae bacterium]
MLNKSVFYLSLAAVLINLNLAAAQNQSKEKTTFQISAPWNADYDVRSDVAIVYGINDAGGNFEQRI